MNRVRLIPAPKERADQLVWLLDLLTDGLLADAMANPGKSRERAGLVELAEIVARAKDDIVRVGHENKSRR